MKYTVSGKGKYLLVPVWVLEKEKAVKLSVDSGYEIMLMLPLGSSDKKPSYFASVSVQALDGDNGENHTAVLSTEDDISALASLFSFSSCEIKPEPQSHRPEFHFTAKTGWINDPNGMVFKDGVYHLYFQYNPFNTKWENMCWGHAESRDLLHWEQKDTVLFPSENAHIFSGSGIKNNRHLLNLPENALVFFYTYAAPRNSANEAERTFSQKIAYSTDDGKTFQLIGKDIIPTLCPDNRDPKVFFHEPTQAYVCALWLEKSTYAFFRSTDLLNWQESQRISLPPAWECPDLFLLECEETHEQKWVFWSADGYYWVGDFDGYHFIAEEDTQKAYLTKLPYAAQTFSGISEVISIAWLRTESTGNLFRGAMSLPRSFSLVKKNGKYVLSHKATAQFSASLKEIYKKQFCKNGVFNTEEKSYMLDVVFAQNVGSYCVKYGGKKIFSNDVFGDLGGEKHIQFFIDGSIGELTNSDCTAIAHWEFFLDAEQKSSCLEIESDGEFSATLYSVGK